jgi:hypothetical protein
MRRRKSGPSTRPPAANTSTEPARESRRDETKLRNEINSKWGYSITLIEDATGELERGFQKAAKNAARTLQIRSQMRA